MYQPPNWRSLWTAAAPLLLALCVAWPSAAAAQPRLAVVIVVDQMRASFLDDFSEEFREGFRQLEDEGAVFSNAYHDHALTETAPGHATIATGVHPSRHGVVANEIWDRAAGELIGAVIDRSGRMTGAERRSGRSPYRMLRTAVGDWLKDQAPVSKVFAVSLKDRSAIFSAGKRPDGAYWYDERTGNFVTSDYYRAALPDWVAAFNAAAGADAYFGSSWTPLDSEDGDAGRTGAARLGSGAVRYSDFPHPLVGAGKTPDRRYYTRFRPTPFADRLTLDFAETLIDAEELGRDDSTDLLFVGLSASDFIGHRYGPRSAEMRDHYARLDGYLGEFFGFLNSRVGRSDYLIVLTADHGSMPVPERLAESGVDAGRMQWDDLLAGLQPVVEDAYERGIVTSLPTLRYDFGVIFNFGDARPPLAEVDALSAIVAASLDGHPFVRAAFTHKQLREGLGQASPWLAYFEHSFYPDRAPDVVVFPTENHLLTDQATGTSHGSPYEYDRHVPLIFLGSGIEAGARATPVRTVDIAPTLAGWLGIEAPADLDGEDLGPRLRMSE